MNKIILIIQKEFLSRVKTRAFIITTLLAPLGMILILVLPVWLNNAGSDVKYIAVLDESNLITPIESKQNKVIMETVYGKIDSFKTNYMNQGYMALIHIPGNFDINNSESVEIYTDKQLGLLTKSGIESSIADRIRQLRIIQAGYNEKLIREFTPKIELIQIKTGEEEIKNTRIIIASVIGYAMGFIIYIALLIYGMMVMRGVIQEKTSRIIEIMVSSVRPFQLMAGKIIGIGMVGITQFILWILLSFSVMLITGFFIGTEVSGMELSGNELLAETDETALSPKIVSIMGDIQQLPIIGLSIAFIFYFLGGFFLYGALFAAIGSAVGEEGDAQSLTFPVTVPIIISLLIMISVINEPDSSLAFWASVIPFTSPIVMPVRIAFGVPAWELIVSIMTLILGFLGTTWLAAKIYRTGILMYGKKVSLIEIFRWLKYKE